MAKINTTILISLLLFASLALTAAVIKNVYVIPAISDTKIIPTTDMSSYTQSNLINMQASPTEYTSSSFVISSDSSISSLNVAASDLTGSSGTIQNSNIQIRSVKCWYVGGPDGDVNIHGYYLTPDLLLNDDSLLKVDGDTYQYTDISNPNGKNLLKMTNGSYICVSNATPSYNGPVTIPISQFSVQDASGLQSINLPGNYNKQFFVTLHVPNGASAGNYTGTITLRDNTTIIKTITLNVQVLPITLPPPGVEYSIYYYGRLTADGQGSISASNKTVQQYTAEQIDMVQHGITNSNVYVKNGTILQQLQIRQTAGMSNSNLYTHGGDINDPKLIPYYMGIFAPYGVKKLYLYGEDEQSMNNTTERTLMTTAQSLGGGYFNSQNTDQATSVADILDIAIVSKAPDAALAALYHSYGHKIYSYDDPQTVSNMPNTFRLNFGLKLWQNNYDGAMDYCYQSNFGTIWNDFDSAAGTRDHCFAYPTNNGVIDTLKYEGFREGVNDMRYLAALQNEIVLAKSQGKNTTDAENYLTALKKTDLTKSNLTRVRSTIAGYIIALQNDKHYLIVNSGSNSGFYQTGSTVTITANAAPSGLAFSKWTGDIQYLSNSSTTTATVTMPDHDISLTANYAYPWYDFNYSYRKILTIDHTKISNTNQTDFPVLVSITDSSLKTIANGGKVQSGNDIIFTLPDKKLLSYEIESYNGSTGGLIAWVKVPVLSASSDTYIEMYYGNPNVNTSQENASDVWSNGFLAVYHMDFKGNSSVLKDSTRNHNDLSTYGGMTTSNCIFSKIGSGVKFNGVNNYATSNFTIPGDKATISTWVKDPTIGAGNGSFLIRANSNSRTYFQIGSWGFIFTLGNTQLPVGVTAANTVGNHYYAISWSNISGNSYANVYFDNSRIGNNLAYTGSSTGSYITLGGFSRTGSENAAGILDEVRISSVARSIDWERTEYNMENSPSSFIIEGNEEMQTRPMGYIPYNPGISGGQDTLKHYLIVNIGNNSGIYQTGSTVTITANAAPSGLAFSKWTGDIQYLSNSSTTTATVTMPDHDISLTANYAYPWYDFNYSYRKTLTIDHTKVSNTNQTDFPVLVSITDSSLKTIANGGKVQNGNDIIFTLPDKTLLSYEIESYDGSKGTLIAWIKVPILSTSSDTYIEMYYGNPKVNTSQEKASDVWSNGFLAVYHMDFKGNSSVLKDSTQNHNDLFTYGGMATSNSVSGKIGNGVYFDGINNYATRNFTIPGDKATISTWIKDPAVGAGNGNFLIRANSNSATYFQISSWGFIFREGSTQLPAGVTAANTVGNHYYAMSWSNISGNSYSSSYFDGSRINNNVAFSGVSTGSYITLGSFSRTGSGNAAGILDEVRVSSVTRSTDWEKTEYNMENSPSSFMSVGNEEIQT